MPQPPPPNQQQPQDNDRTVVIIIDKDKSMMINTGADRRSAARGRAWRRSSRPAPKGSCS